MADFWTPESNQSHASGFRKMPAKGQSSGEMRFKIQDTDLAKNAIMDDSRLVSKHRNDLLMQSLTADVEKTLGKIDLDIAQYVFNETHSTVELGTPLVLSVGNSRLMNEFGTQLRDVSASAQETHPAGNHDFIANLTLHLSTDYPEPFTVTFPTVFALKDEHYIGNYATPENSTPEERQAGRRVACTIMPTDLDMRGTFSSAIVKRTITPAMHNFFRMYPNQTADTMSNHVTIITGKNGKPVEALLHYDPEGRTGRETSCVSFWHAACDHPDKKPLKENGNGFASMDPDLYFKLEAKAKQELQTHLSLGDVTSKNFAIEIAPLARNGGQKFSLGAFENIHFGASPDDSAAHLVGKEDMTLGDLHDMQRYSWKGRIVVEYKKINDGK